MNRPESLCSNPKVEQNKRSLMQRVVASRLGKGALTLTAAAVGVTGIGVASHSHDVSRHNQYIETQKEIAPVLSNLMVSIDKQMVEAQKQNPSNFLPLQELGNDTVQITKVTPEHTTTYAVMGTFESGPDKGKPNPEAPVYYYNSTNSGSVDSELISTYEIALSSPAGESYAANESGLGGTSQGWTGIEAASDELNKGVPDGYTYDTSDPSLSNGWGQPNLTSVDVANRIASDFNKVDSLIANS